MEDNSFTVREIIREDVPAIAKIEEQSFTVPWSEGSFRAIFGYDNLHALVALDGDTVVGYVVFSNIFEDGEILNIACASDARRRGIARELLAQSENIMQKKGVLNVFLEVRQSNIAAQSLYTKSGYKNVGFRKNYYKKPVEDAILMRKEIKNTDDNSEEIK